MWDFAWFGVHRCGPLFFASGACVHRGGFNFFCPILILYMREREGGRGGIFIDSF